MKKPILSLLLVIIALVGFVLPTTVLADRPYPGQRPYDRPYVGKPFPNKPHYRPKPNYGKPRPGLIRPVPPRPHYQTKPYYKPRPKPVFVPPYKKHRPLFRPALQKKYFGKPWRKKGWARWVHPIASAVAFGIIIDTLTGNLQDERGNEVVVLGNGGRVISTYEQNGTVYIVTD